MKKLFLGLITVLSFCFLQGQEQITIEKNHNGTLLTITMDSRVATALSTMEENCNRTNSNTYTSTDRASSSNVETPRNTRTSTGRKLSIAEICSRNPKISGFKIQIAVVKSNAEANEIKANFRKKFPRLKVETDASLRPNYKIFAGSYFSKESASSDLKQVKAIYKEAVAVQRTIYCVEGK